MPAAIELGMARWRSPYIFFGAELHGMISGGVTVRREPPWYRVVS